MQFHCIKMRYSNKPKDGIYVKGYGCFSFAKNMGTNATKERAIQNSKSN